jgi:hypothetical protein
MTFECVASCETLKEVEGVLEESKESNLEDDLKISKSGLEIRN